MEEIRRKKHEEYISSKNKEKKDYVEKFVLKCFNANKTADLSMADIQKKAEEAYEQKCDINNVSLYDHNSIFPKHDENISDIIDDYEEALLLQQQHDMEDRRNIINEQDVEYEKSVAADLNKFL